MMELGTRASAVGRVVAQSPDLNAVHYHYHVQAFTNLVSTEWNTGRSNGYRCGHRVHVAKYQCQHPGWLDALDHDGLEGPEGYGGGC